MRSGIEIIQQQTAFSQNIELCREVIFNLRYADITKYTALAESTMISYDTRGVSPYLTVAQRIADLYCTSIERLCGYEINSSLEEVLDMQVRFINRLGGIPIRLYKEKIMLEVSKHLTLSRTEVYKLLSDIYRQMILDLHRFGKFLAINKDEKIAVNFTENFHRLHTFVNVSYRRLGKATDISIGNLTRLEKGNEPMLSSVIKFADFFDVNISQIMSSEPNFDYARIEKEIASKNEIKNVRPPIPDSIIKEQRKQAAELLNKEQVEKIVTKWLNKVNA